MTTIHVIGSDKDQRTVEAEDGRTMMEVLRDLDIGIEGECEGSLACATCHVWVEPAWIPRLGVKTEEEEDMLDSAFNVRDNSRLSCQITISPDVDNITVTIPHK